MKKEGRSRTAGEGDSWRVLLSRPVAEEKLERWRSRLVGLGGGKKNENDDGGEQEQEQALAAA